MHVSFKSYLSTAALLLLVLGLVVTSPAAELFLNPDTVFLHGGTGTDVPLTLEVDAATTSLKLFQIKFNFDPAKLDTVIITEGPLFPSSGGITVFNYYLDQNDTILRIEGLILGPAIDVSGPGVLANITLKVLDTGAIDLSVMDHYMRDINNVPFASDAFGTVFLNDVHPTEFNLLEPAPSATVTGYVGNDVTFRWNGSVSVYPGETVSYLLDYGTDPAFGGAQTTTVAGLTDTLYTVPIEDFQDAVYYWRVTAQGGLYGLDRLSTPGSSSFTYATGAVNPGAFALLIPADSAVIEVTDSTSIRFDWEDAASGIADDSILYIFYMSANPADPGSPIVTWVPYDTIPAISEITLPLASLPQDTFYLWHVRAANALGLTTWATERRTLKLYTENPSCCVGETGNVNGDASTNLTDLTQMVNYLFVTFVAPACPTAANTSGDANCTLNLTDLTRLVNRLFVTFVPCAQCTDFDNTLCPN